MNWRVHAKEFLSANLGKKVMPISGGFKEWCATPCQWRSMPGALDLVQGQALIDIEKQPTLLVHLVGVGKLDGQVADERAQHRVCLAELAPHGGGVNDVYHPVCGRDRPRGAFTLAKD